MSSLSPGWPSCKGLGGKRGAGVPGYGVPGYGVPGVWKTRGLVENTGSQWKTRGLSEKHGGTTISPNNNFSSLKWEVAILLFQIAMKITESAWNAFFDHESEFKNISWERNPFKCQRAVQWVSFAWGVYFVYSQARVKRRTSHEPKLMTILSQTSILIQSNRTSAPKR